MGSDDKRSGRSEPRRAPLPARDVSTRRDTIADGSPAENVPELPELDPPRPESLLGVGGMATVHLAFDRSLGREVALKRLREDVARDPIKQQDFVSEARITGQLQHPNVVQIHALAIDRDGHPYFTMQIIEGRNLREWLEHPARKPGHRERWTRGIDILLKICDALEFAHSRGILHRDVKPENIMVGLHGRVYLADWGLAVAPEPRGTFGRRLGLAGTPGYMAPEQARGEALDQRADVFSLGAVLYEVVLGVGPYGAAPDLIGAAARGAVVPPRSVAVPGVPPALLEIIDRATKAHADERYESIDQLQQALKHFLDDGSLLPQRSYRPGEVVVRQGDVGHEAYIVVEGSCRVVQQTGTEENLLRQMGPGEVFGELALVLEVPRTASVVANEATTLLVISKDVLEASGALAGWSATLLRALAARFTELERRVRGDGSER